MAKSKLAGLAKLRNAPKVGTSAEALKLMNEAAAQAGKQSAAAVRGTPLETLRPKALPSGLPEKMSASSVRGTPASKLRDIAKKRVKGATRVKPTFNLNRVANINALKEQPKLTARAQAVATKTEGSVGKRLAANAAKYRPMMNRGQRLVSASASKEASALKAVAAKRAPSPTKIKPTSSMNQAAKIKALKAQPKITTAAAKAEGSVGKRLASSASRYRPALVRGQRLAAATKPVATVAPKAVAKSSLKAMAAKRLGQAAEKISASRIGQAASAASKIGTKTAVGRLGRAALGKAFKGANVAGQAITYGEAAYEGYQAVKALRERDELIRKTSARHGLNIRRPGLTTGDVIKTIFVPGYVAPASDPNQLEIKKRRKK